MQTICCVCGRVKAGPGWTRSVVVSGPEVSHGYCPVCFSRAMIRWKIDVGPMVVPARKTLVQEHR